MSHRDYYDKYSQLSTGKRQLSTGSIPLAKSPTRHSHSAPCPPHPSRAASPHQCSIHARSEQIKQEGGVAGGIPFSAAASENVLSLSTPPKIKVFVYNL